MVTRSHGRWSLAAVGVALAGVALAWLVSGGAMFSPGGLHAGDSTSAPLGGVPSHAALGRDCAACHAGPWRPATMEQRCLQCHIDIQAERRDTATLHGRLTDAAACVACHTEHAGPRGSLTRLDGRTLAHEQFGFALVAHRQTAAGTPFACGDCHAPDRWRFDPQRCVSCHREYQPQFVTAHVAEWGAGCLACHDGGDRFARGAFDHDRLRFPLTGAHRQTTCAACHQQTRTLAAFGEVPATCIGCHRGDDEHRGDFGEQCGDCHSTATWKGARFDHVFPLDHGEEGQIGCKTCHPVNLRTYTCYGCHEHAPARVRAEHVEEGISGDLRNCARCHPTGREDEGEGEREEHEGRRRGEHERE